MMTTDDETLVARALAGDRQAFAALVERYQKPVFNAALRILRDPEDARDVAQTAFLKAYSRLADFNPSFKFFSWLYRIAVNEAINQGQRRPSFEPVDDAIEDTASGPEQLFTESRTAAALERALHALSFEQRAVITLRYQLDCSHEDMSVVLDIPVKTVKSRLFEARKQLRARMVEAGETNFFVTRG